MLKVMNFWLVVFILQAVAAIVAIPRPPTQRELLHTYLVRFKSNSTKQERDKHVQWMGNLDTHRPNQGIRHIFTLAFHGYSAILNNVTLGQVRQREEIASIDHVGLSTEQGVIPDHVSNIVDQRLNSLDDTVVETYNRAASDTLFVHNKGWNANRISHRNYTNGYSVGPWMHDRNLGKGVRVFLLDTGVNLQHPGFHGSQVSFGRNFVGVRNGAKRTNDQDNHGHGTMCAGVIAGEKHGLGPDAHLISVKIADDENSSACDDVVAGIEWVVAQPGNNRMKVISMSHYGFTGKPDVSTVVAAAIQKGVHFVVCAGNDGKDACQVQPSNAPGVISVGSVNAFNKLPIRGTTDPGGQEEFESSNVGKCVTVFAPGSRVPTLNAKITDLKVGYVSWGTSVAAPQVAALIANRLSRVGPQSPSQIKRWLQRTATEGQVIGDLEGAPNLIAYNGAGT